MKCFENVLDEMVEAWGLDLQGTVRTEEERAAYLLLALRRGEISLADAESVARGG